MYQNDKFMDIITINKQLCEQYLKDMENGTMNAWKARWCLEDMNNMKYRVSKEITDMAIDCIKRLLVYSKQKGFIEESVDFDTFCDKGIILLIKR